MQAGSCTVLSQEYQVGAQFFFYQLGIQMIDVEGS